MEVSHNFRFRWNDHVPHLSQIFSELRLEEVYCDTTLISDDGFVVKAHGAVLSATSRYFERVLCDVTADQHPIIVLKGANFTELSCLLDYIYQGVTQVDQHLMESVLDVADMLEIKGLSKMKNNLSIKKLIAPSPPSSTVSRGSPLCSSPSKSPSPPAHSPCPQSPGASYASSTLLKVDAEDNELPELNQKANKHSFHEGKATMRPMECKDYSANSSKYPSCQNTEFLDQTLGIDLSLSRATNEDNDRSTSRNFSLYEDTPLRKRKIMKSEEINSQLADFEWGKVADKVDEIMPHKKKKLFTRSDDGRENCHEIQHLPIRSSSCGEIPFGFESRMNSDPRAIAETWDECDPEYSRTSELVRNLEFMQDEPNEQIQLKPDIEPDTFSDRFSDFGSEDPPEAVRSIHQNPYLLAAEIANQKLAMKGQRLSWEDSRSSPCFQSPRSLSKVEADERKLSWRRPSSACSISMETEKIGRSVTPRSHRQMSLGGSEDVIGKEVKDLVCVQVQKPGPSQKKEVTPYEEMIAKTFQTMESMAALKRPLPKVKRPPSKYNLFLKENFHAVSKQNPNKKTGDIVRIISGMWQNLPEKEKEYWAEKANAYVTEFKARHPDYVFCSKKVRDDRYEFIQKKAEKRNMFRIQPISF